MGYARIYVDAKKREVDVKDYDDLNREQKKKAYRKFIVNRKKSVEEQMEYFWFDKNGNSYQLQAKDNYIKRGLLNERLSS